MVRSIGVADFPASWQEATPRERSHDSHTYTTRFMLRLDEPSQTKLQQLINQLGASKAAIIRHLIAQAKPEDSPKLAHEGKRTLSTTAPAIAASPTPFDKSPHSPTLDACV
jgi:hypothetical protein